ncbi:hypothetical protein FRACYDRAFT_241385 [Fragilariopsis cylindrus CCMP1102]|uniref:Serine hydrolase domain-containing protein n=1 Tax=Fragilariopsis cylindrus CCMP1102 TaxID=635003 RepID=A0A1E7F9K7_9STRA|nr:hypothetical protein FRACYDRAFT_241385 [Fragilariopsis cylindrus CCMP1102]|eukprot:OEU14826.1 hypothetical protein FRACYDRAFT_241385 [Fragilariopsis cylindrus CCMP1102]
MKTSSTTTATTSSSSSSSFPPPYRLVFEPSLTTTTILDRKKISSVTPPQQQPEQQPSQYCCSSRNDTTTSIPIRGVIFMLHGWAQNVFVFSNRAKKLTKRLTKAGYRVVFLQAPHRLPPIIPTEQQQQQQQQHICDGNNNTTIINNGNENNNEHIDSSCGSFSREYAYAWFFYDSSNENNNNDEPIVLPSPTGNYRGMDRSLKFIHEEIQAVRNNNNERKKSKNKKNGDDDDDDDQNQNQDANDVPLLPSPPVLVLGFSQGAVLVHKIATLTCNNDDDNDNDDDCCWKDVRKCILVIYLEEPCFGLGSGILWEHPRGHVLPQDRNFCNRVLEFVTDPLII